MGTMSMVSGYNVNEQQEIPYMLVSQGIIILSVPNSKRMDLVAKPVSNRRT